MQGNFRRSSLAAGSTLVRRRPKALTPPSSERDKAVRSLGLHSKEIDAIADLYRRGNVLDAEPAAQSPEAPNATDAAVEG